jgi:hypothetical protein
MPTRRVAGAGYLLLFLGACLAAFYLILPLGAGQVGFDAASSVLYFDRLIQGRHLESFVTTTPKPLLTVVYGLLYNLTGDWRSISLVAIGAYGATSVLAAMLVRRFGGLPAAIFAGVAVIGSQALIEDVAMSYAVVFAFAGCLLAGLAVTASRPRYGWAGLALALAALARFEVLLIPAAALVVLTGAWLWAGYHHGRRPDPRAWRILIGFAAVPLQFAHDWLLTGNLLYAEYVPIHASLQLPIDGPLQVGLFVAQSLWKIGPLVALGVVGAAILGRRREWAILVGLAAMGPGVALFLMFLAYRQIFVSSRYIAPVDLAVVVGAGIGFGAIRIPDLVAVAGRLSPRWRLAVTSVVAVLVAAAFSLPFAPLSETVKGTIRDSLRIEQDVDIALPSLRQAIAAIPGATAWPGPTNGAPSTLIAPAALRPQLIVDLGLPTTQVSGMTSSRLRTDGTYPVVGQIIFHDQLAEPDRALDVLEVSRPTTIGKIVVTPLLADPTSGIWVDRIDAAP